MLTICPTLFLPLPFSLSLLVAYLPFICRIFPPFPALRYILQFFNPRSSIYAHDQTRRLGPSLFISPASISPRWIARCASLILVDIMKTCHQLDGHLPWTSKWNVAQIRRDVTPACSRIGYFFSCLASPDLSRRTRDDVSRRLVNIADPEKSKC